MADFSIQKMSDLRAGADSHASPVAKNGLNDGLDELELMRDSVQISGGFKIRKYDHPNKGKLELVLKFDVNPSTGNLSFFIVLFPLGWLWDRTLQQFVNPQLNRETPDAVDKFFDDEATGRLNYQACLNAARNDAHPWIVADGAARDPDSIPED